MVKLNTALISFLVAVSVHVTGAPTGPTFEVSVDLSGVTYVNKGLVAFGLIPHNFVDSTGDTMGGIGSAIALKSWKACKGKYEGTFLVQPDRGFNVNETVDYQARHHEVDFELFPYYGTDNLDFDTAKETLKLEYKKTTLYFERENTATSGLDPVGVRPETGDDPGLPTASDDYPHLSVDTEGLVLNKDGTVWVSDEYGPHIYRFAKNGHLIQVIQPPLAVLPHDAHGELNFTAETDPNTGRTPNQGFEGLTYDAHGKTLYALLQSAAWQDGGDNRTTSRYTRLLAYDVSTSGRAHERPTLVGEWVVPLPQDSKGSTLGSNEILFARKGVFLILSRDGNGRGGDDPTSLYKQADLFDISGATDIHGTKFDDPASLIATGGVLDASITPAKYVSFVNYLDSVQLARFGLHNGAPNDHTLICAKWESLALASVGDDKYPDDYFLFTAADNDFITTQGVSVGRPYDAGVDSDNQFLVFRVTLPGASVPKL